MLRVTAVLLAMGTALADPAGVWLDVPFVKQRKHGCGAASIAMIERYWHGVSPADLPQTEMQASEVETRLQALGFRTFAFKGEWADLDQHLTKGRPLIVCLRPGPLHYVVVVGLDRRQNLVLVNDPARRKLLKVERSEFERQWGAAGNWTLLAVPSQQSAEPGPPAAPREIQGEKRFALDLAGLAFKRQDYPAAKANVRRALRLDPDDDYTNDFIATLYFLDGNVEAALRHWNRLGKPRIEAIKMDPKPAVDPILLDRAFAFSHGGVVGLGEFRTTKARLDHLEIFPRYQIELAPGADQKFDVVFRPLERNNGAVSTLVSLFRGVAYQTVYPEVFNIGRSAWNLTSQLRWDPNKRRASIAFAGPLRRDPGRRLRMTADARDENWDIGSPLKLQKLETGAELDSVVNGRLSWRSGVFVANRRRFDDGPSIKYRAGADFIPVAIPEKRFTLAARTSWEIGRMFRAPDPFSKLEGSLDARWFPLARRDDYEMRARYRLGRTWGSVPFDELFSLGLDRDHDFWLRAHPATREGRKGAGPLGREFMLVNWELDKIVYEGAFFRVSLGPFLDAGAARRPSSGEWQWDSGAQCKVRAPGGLILALSYGRDLRTGHDAFFATVGR